MLKDQKAKVGNIQSVSMWPFACIGFLSLWQSVLWLDFRNVRNLTKQVQKSTDTKLT
jgi:hypothetical protein